MSEKTLKTPSDLAKHICLFLIKFTSQLTNLNKLKNVTKKAEKPNEKIFV